MQISEKRECKKCTNSYSIELGDFDFYARMKVPAPILCPDCRFKRRAQFRNERILYSRSCDLCKKTIISIYHALSRWVNF